MSTSESMIMDVTTTTLTKTSMDTRARSRIWKRIRQRLRASRVQPPAPKQSRREHCKEKNTIAHTDSITHPGTRTRTGTKAREHESTRAREHDHDHEHESDHEYPRESDHEYPHESDYPDDQAYEDEHEDEHRYGYIGDTHTHTSRAQRKGTIKI
ncbi:hypothetical protein PYCC9005_004594 [Savitreella phatthalungensis]